MYLQDERDLYCSYDSSRLLDLDTQPRIINCIVQGLSLPKRLPQIPQIYQTSRLFLLQKGPNLLFFVCELFFLHDLSYLSLDGLDFFLNYVYVQVPKERSMQVLKDKIEDCGTKKNPILRAPALHQIRPSAVQINA